MGINVPQIGRPGPVVTGIKKEAGFDYYHYMWKKQTGTSSVANVFSDAGSDPTIRFLRIDPTSAGSIEMVVTQSVKLNPGGAPFTYNCGRSENNTINLSVNSTTVFDEEVCPSVLGANETKTFTQKQFLKWDVNSATRFVQRTIGGEMGRGLVDPKVVETIIKIPVGWYDGVNTNNVDLVFLNKL
jgi:hypothetical protein